jgi:hypothetical protein
MKYHDPLKHIQSKTRSHWDRDGTRPAVRWAFGKALQYRTPELGAEVYGLESHELIVDHTCKSRACSSCGYRATVQWLRERWAALPEVPYKGITFTMPDVLWPVFRDHPRLASALPALAAVRCVGNTTSMFRRVIATLHCPEQIRKTARAATTNLDPVGRE